MKKLLFAFSFVCAGVMTAAAQDTTSVDQQNQQYQTMQQNDQQDRERINSRDLPDAVKRSLEGQEFRGWLINAAYKTTGMQEDAGNMEQQQGDTTAVQGQPQQGNEEEEIYVVELKNGAQTKTVRFTKDGERLDDTGMEHDQN